MELNELLPRAEVLDKPQMTVFFVKNSGLSDLFKPDKPFAVSPHFYAANCFIPLQ